jgi:hypothetical protein
VTVVNAWITDTDVDVDVMVNVGVGRDRQPHAVEIREHAKALSGGGAPPQLTGSREVVLFFVNEEDEV